MVHLCLASGWSTTQLNAQIIPFHPVPTSLGTQYQGSFTTITLSQSLDTLMGPLMAWDDGQLVIGLLIVIIAMQCIGGNKELLSVSLKRKQDFVGIFPK